MTKSQNTTSEQHCIKQNEKSFIQKDLSLTELCQKGELKDGEYYCRTTHDSSVRKRYISNIDNDNMIEVLAPVPSYEEWKAKDYALTALLAEYGKLTKELQDEKEKHMTRPSLRSPADEVVIEKQVWESTLNRSMALEAENAQLKKLLKECESSIQYYQETYGAMDLDTYTLLSKLKEVLK